jgi:hypothetical protein
MSSDKSDLNKNDSNSYKNYKPAPMKNSGPPPQPSKIKKPAALETSHKNISPQIAKTIQSLAKEPSKPEVSESLKKELAGLKLSQLVTGKGGGGTKKKGAPPLPPKGDNPSSSSSVAALPNMKLDKDTGEWVPDNDRSAAPPPPSSDNLSSSSSFRSGPPPQPKNSSTHLLIPKAPPRIIPPPPPEKGGR